MLSPLDLLDLARSAATRAARFIREVERPADPEAWVEKGTRDFVTEVDRTAERLITEVLLAGDPRARILGEELSPDVPLDGLVWVVDPLDGTTNFLHGYPAYAVSIAAAMDGVLTAGVVHHVPRDEVFWATPGGGAWCGDRQLRVSPITSPARALIGTGFPFKDLATLDGYQRQFARVAAGTSGIRRAGSAAIDLADVAAGRFEGFWEQHLSAWDIAAGLLLIREAGGRATDYAGRDLGVEHGPVVAGNPAVHRWLLETLRDGI
ncbi:MAG TPA: inositol monophosphatase family protein [Gemmatimonadales bacterium]|nr:inositol monophosphatase family protein [Gemmatimonadales bacterium]